MKHLLVIIDGNAILHRAWHAMPPLQTKDGRIISAAYGFTTMLMKVMKDLKPTHLAVTFDLPGGTFRHEAFTAYKAQRVKQPQELYDQIPMVKDVLAGFGIPVFEKEGFEADDVIGTLSKKAPKDAEVVIVTGDLDTLQLVDDRTKVYTQRKGMSDIVVYDAAAVKARYGLSPSQLIDYKAMRGDTSDNLPGLHGIGEKGASELLQKYGDIDGIYKALKKQPNDFKPRVLKALTDGEKDVPLSKELVTIVRDVPFKFDFEKTKLGEPDLKRLKTVFQDLEFKTLLPKIEREAATVSGEVKKEKKKRKTGPADFSKSDRLGFRFAYAGDDRITPKFSALVVSDGVNCDTMPCAEGTLPGPAETFLTAKDAKVGHDVKNDMIALAAQGKAFSGVIDDVMIMSYLLNPGSRAHKLSDLLFEATGMTLSAQDSLFLEDKTKHLCDEAMMIVKAADDFESRLKTENIWSIYADIERPLIPVLAAMERHGIKVDAGFLKEMSIGMKKRVVQLTSAITEAAGEEFNINSPAQLQKILFEKLALPTKGIKKTGTGQLSTGADELEKLRGSHPIIQHIFEHRELSKLLSTYVSAIPELIHPSTGRLHSHFNQAVAATGRLSSSDPNLQNIPIRTELGREIRKAFIAEKGHVLVAADYSQIELRIAASIAGDAKMMEAFLNGEDIHTATAAKIWDVAAAEVTFEQRRAAKAINFGILYGMGSTSLAASAGLSRDEAKTFIDKYLGVYVGLRDYMNQAKAQAKSLGYVETLFGRRRYLPEINSGVPFVRAEAERMAVNMPIQGTNADIIKMAMVRLHERIGREYGFGPEAEVKMLLQVHDELVFEVKESEAKKAAEWIRETMQDIVKLKVPLDVDVEMGYSWGQLKEVN
jgi:DNA polymerase-1